MGDTVCIITRTKNRPALLPRAVASALMQTHRDWVHTIVNDGGDPAPVDALVARHAGAYGGRCTVVHNPASCGMEAASNIAIRACSGDYVVIHDDDDSWEPAFLETAVAALRQLGPDNPVQGVITLANKIVERLTDTGAEEISREPYDHSAGMVNFFRMLAQNTFAPIAFVFRRSALDSVGFYDEGLPVLGDWDFNIRFLIKFDIAVIPERLANYHHREDAAAPTVYSNTVVGGLDLHKKFDALLRNRWLRDDFAAGRPGLGMASNSAIYLKRIEDAQHAQKVIRDAQAAQIDYLLAENQTLSRAVEKLKATLDRLREENATLKANR